MLVYPKAIGTDRTRKAQETQKQEQAIEESGPSKTA